jgi:hypothetical protein
MDAITAMRATIRARQALDEYLGILVLGRGIKNFILRLALLPAFLFSGSGHAIPMLAGSGHPGDAKGHDAKFVRVVSANKSEPESDGMQALAHALWRNLESSSIGALPGKYHGLLGFLNGFYPLFGFSAQDRDMEKFITWENLDPYNDNVIPINLVGFEEDDIAIAEFFATLGIDIADWHMVTENSRIPGHHDAAPAPDGPAVSRVGQRKECLQRQREFLRKSELHDDDCFEAGGWGGFNSNIGRSRISAIVNGGSANPNFQNNPGAGAGPGGGAGGGGSGGTSPGTSAGGSNGDNGQGSGGGVPDTGGDPGTGTGGGEAGGGGSEVRPVPEPGTFFLLLLGFACVHHARSQRGGRKETL